MNIYLIGYRCTGKTTLGKALARRLSRTFVDTDERIAREAGKTIARIVAEEGWEGFRNREREVLRAVSAVDGQVVATGGGVVLDARNVRDMKETGEIIWLRAAPETLSRRMAKDPNTADSRPSLTSKGMDAEILGILAARDPLYRAAMDLGVDTDDFNVDQLCERITQALQRFETTSVNTGEER